MRPFARRYFPEDIRLPAEHSTLSGPATRKRCECISERFLLPVLGQLVETLPFVIQAFHCDNGSGYISHRVAQLPEKLRIEQTRSRSRQTNDNALVESKNGSTIRKHLGYSHIPGYFAKDVNAFARRSSISGLETTHSPIKKPRTFRCGEHGSDTKAAVGYFNRPCKSPLSLRTKAAGSSSWPPSLSTA